MKPRVKPKKRKPTKKIGKGKKLPPKNPGIAAKLVDRILNKDISFNRRPEKKLQEIFAGVCVKQSLELGIIEKTIYNKELKIDLPIYLRLVEASRHNSVSAVVAFTEFRKLYPNLTIDAFISDSASDNYATYKLLHHWNIKTVIALNSTNKGNFKYPRHICVDDNGTPICPGGNKMIYWGYCAKDRSRLKWRCSKACAKHYEKCKNCSLSNIRACYLH